MRLKKDATSWKASGLKKRLEPIPEEPLQSRRKNTRRWCKGRVGVEHDYQWQEIVWVGTIKKTIKVCSNCKKQDWRSL